MAVEGEQLVGSWVHAHEEGGEGEMVLRPPAHPLPPSRGRLALELRADGSMTERGPGPSDRPVEGGGSWELAGDELVIRHGRRPGWRARVLSADVDRLVLSRPR